ncbi:SIR2 family protein [Niveispirillum sp. KHB5.9]|uniref:SIR2 family protein n=1 Tax=Niveispirillum sp. KHB5.9 TaxID=3400269 RepID=UPI003A8BD1A6
MNTKTIGLMIRDRGRASERRSKPICLFLGAGTDIEAGGLTFQQLKKDAIHEFQDSRYVDALDNEEIDKKFEEILKNETGDRTRGLIIDWIFNRIERLNPTEAHIITAILVKVGGIDAIVTTNFDTLIERAEKVIGGRLFQIYAPGVAQPDMLNGEAVPPPAPILLKLHGDLESKIITHLSDDEIVGRSYSESSQSLLIYVLKTHRLIFVGYSGHDNMVAEAIRASDRPAGEVYWVNRAPPEHHAPVVQALGPTNIAFVKSTYGSFMQEVAELAFKGTNITIDHGTFIRSIVASRIKEANERFLSSLQQRSKAEREAIFIPRGEVELQLEKFRSKKGNPLAVLASPSGCGKTSLVARLCDQEREDGFPSILVLRAQSLSDLNLAARISSELEYGSGNAIGRLYDFASWLNSMNHELTIVLEAVNEFSTSIDEVARLVRSVIEILIRIRNQKSIKFLITIRQEIWNDVFPLLDIMDVGRVLWSSSDKTDRLTALTLGRFSLAEAEQAFKIYAQKYRSKTRWGEISPSMQTALRDPFLLGFVMREGASLRGPSVSRRLIEEAIRQQLLQRLSPRKLETLLSSLSKLAATMIRDRSTTIQESMLADCGVHAEDLALLIDAGILTDHGNRNLDFGHDRLAEVFFACAIEDQAALPLQDPEDLQAALRQAGIVTRLRGALVSCFAMGRPDQASRNRTLLRSACQIIGRHLQDVTQTTKNLHSFVKDVLIEMAAHNPDQYRDLFGQDLLSGKSPAFMRPILLQAANFLPDGHTFAIWIDALEHGSESERVEVETFLYDRVARNFLNRWELQLSPITSPVLSRWFRDSKAGPVLQICRLLNLASRLGPDNLSQREWDAFTQELSRYIQEISIDLDLTPSDDLIATWGAPLINVSEIDANRFIFNARPDWLSAYYMDPARSGPFKDLWSKLQDGSVLTADDFMRIAPLASEIGHPIRFIIANLLWAISFRQKPTATVDQLVRALERLPANIPVEQIDLLLSCVFASHSINGVNAFSILDRFTRSIFSRLPQAYIVNPGQWRAQMQGKFLDDFDQQFEDGFNPLAFYFYHAPSEARQNVSYARFDAKGGTVPFYDELLLRFETEKSGKGIMQIVHALGQMASIWPECAMDELLKLVGRQEPTIRRSLIRVLAECFHRFPVETAALIARSGAALSSDDRYLIECALDSRIKHRTFEQLQWSRIIVTLEAVCNQPILPIICQALITATSWSEAMQAIIRNILASLRKTDGP